VKVNISTFSKYKKKGKSVESLNKNCKVNSHFQM
jgi:hypothetical protein